MIDDADWPLAVPQSQAEIESIHKARKRLAVERARQSKFLAPRVSSIDADRLDDPEEWRKIPVLTRDELRKLPAESFQRDFAVRSPPPALELWRAGAASGKPLLYPRSAEDVRYALGVSFRRIWPCIGAQPGEIAHVAFPLGVHPIGQLLLRSAQLEGLCTVWAGAGTATPGTTQLELIRDVRPAIVATPPSYGLRLAKLAESLGHDLREYGVRKLLVGAEPLAEAQRARLERQWNATVYDSFSVPEGGMVAVERDGTAGMAAWADLYLLEVVDPSSGRPVTEGEAGALVITPLWTNSITPFLRWYTGDLVTLRRQPRTADPFSVFPVLNYVLRTDGVFTLHGVELNHVELEQFMFAQESIADFRAEADEEDGLDVLRLQIEIQRDLDPLACSDALRSAFKARFELVPSVEVLVGGTLTRNFEAAPDSPRFADRRRAS